MIIIINSTNKGLLSKLDEEEENSTEELAREKKKNKLSKINWRDG